MKSARVLTFSSLILALTTAPVVATADDDACERVDGRITSRLLGEGETFSNGEPCLSPLLLCTEGRFTGDLKGRFRFTAQTLTPYAALDGDSPDDVAATTGTIELETRFCRGTLVLDDTSAFSLNLDGSVASIETVNGASDGGCTGASGRLRVTGIFMEGCVDCSYEGEICLAGGGGDRDKDDDRD